MPTHHLHDVQSLLGRCQREGYKPPAAVLDELLAAEVLPSPEELREQRRDELTAAIASGDATAIQTARDRLDATSIGASYQTFVTARDGRADNAVALVGDDAFTFIRDKYNAVGERFAANVARTDITADIRAALRMPEAARVAWGELETDRANLDRLAALLGDITKSWGGTNYARNYTPGATYNDPHGYHAVPYVLGLLVDLRESHPRRVVEALTWIDEPPARINPTPPTPLDRICRGPGGKWAAVVAAGAVPRCDLEFLADFRVFVLLDPQNGMDPYASPENWDLVIAALAEADARRKASEEFAEGSNRVVRHSPPFVPPDEPGRIAAMRKPAKTAKAGRSR